MKTLVITWIQFLTILQNPSECGDLDVFLRLPKYVGFSHVKDLTSLQELPRIFVNVTKAIGMFVDIWLGKDVDPNCLYNPKPLNDNALHQNRPFAQSVRGTPSNVQPTGTIRTTKTQADIRKGK